MTKDVSLTSTIVELDDNLIDAVSGGDDGSIVITGSPNTGGTVTVTTMSPDEAAREIAKAIRQQNAALQGR